MDTPTYWVSVEPTHRFNLEEIDQRSLRYAEQLQTLFNALLLDIIRTRCPAIEAVFKGEKNATDDNLLYAMQARGIWFQLTRIIEENATNRRRRDTETSLGLSAIDSSFGQVLAEARQLEIPGETVANILRQLTVSPVITAHPTESKRITVLEIHRRIYLLLKQLELNRWTPWERNRVIEQLHAEIDLLWTTGEIRIEKPSVSDEIAWGLHFFNSSLFPAINTVHTRLETAIKIYYPDCENILPLRPTIRFGSWIGGDRDGNPFVTVATSFQTLQQAKLQSLLHLRTKLRSLLSKFSIAEHAVEIPDYFRSALDKFLEEHGQDDTLKKRNPGELFRQYIRCILDKLTNTIAQEQNQSSDKQTAGYYQSSQQFCTDLQIMYDCLQDISAKQIADHYLSDLIRQVQSFGFFTVSLDLRENSTRIRKALAEVLEKSKFKVPETPDDYHRWLIDLLGSSWNTLPEISDLTEETNETLSIFKLVADTRTSLEKGAIGNFILSMTQSSTDIISVYVLAKFAGLFSGIGNNEACTLMVVPLLETIADLRNGPEILRNLSEVDSIRRTIDLHQRKQEIMIGYSDSNKDGGFVCSNWETYKAQSHLYQTSQEVGLPISFFHGRGGSSSRGGAPTAEAILSQPPDTVAGQMRVTEQGEVVSAKYANRGTAENQLEILSASVLKHSLMSTLTDRATDKSEFLQIMEELSNLSFNAYRKLADEDGLVDFYNEASPAKELALLKIGSRPMHRFGAANLDDLRAIPWVFAWSQNRMLIPGWFGFGSAIKVFLKNDNNLDLLKTMSKSFPLFRLIIEEVEKSLLQVNMEIAESYAALVTKAQIRDKIFGLIKLEYELSREMLLTITEERGLCERFPRFRRRLERRLRIVDQTGFEQVQLVKEFRAMNSGEKEYHNKLVTLLLSINCVSTGLGWTG